MYRRIFIFCIVIILSFCSCSKIDQMIKNDLLEKSAAAESNALNSNLEEQYIILDEDKTEEDIVWPPRVLEKLTPLYIAKEPITYNGDGFTITIEKAAIYDALMQDIDGPLEGKNDRIVEHVFEVPFNENMLYNGIFYSMTIQYDNPELHVDACDSYTVDTYYKFSFFLNNEELPDRGMIANTYFDQGNLTNNKLGFVQLKNEGFMIYDRHFDENSSYVLCMDSEATGHVEIEFTMIKPE